MEAVESFKRIRAHAHVEEGKVCFKCVHRLTCPVAGKPPKQMTDTAVQDMLSFYTGLNGMEEAAVSQRIWNAGYKTMDLFGVVLDDLKEAGEEFKLFDTERIKQSEERLKDESKAKSEKKISTKSKSKAKTTAEEGE